MGKAAEAKVVRVPRILLFFLFLPSFFLLFFSKDCFAQTGWNFMPSVTASETYNSNIFSTATEVDDYITRVETNLGAIYNGPNIGLRGNYILSLHTFAKHSNANVVTQDGSFNVDLNRLFRKFFKSSDVTITEDFTFTPDLKDYYFDEERGDIGPLSSYGIKTRRTDAFRNAFGINLLLPVTHKVSLSTSYSNLLTDYKEAGFRDNVTNTVGFGIRYSFPKYVFFSNVNASAIRLDTEDSNSYSLILGVKHAHSQLTTLDINAGVVTLDNETGGRRSTLSGKVSITKRLKTHTYNAGYSRILNATSGITGVANMSDMLYINMTNTYLRNLSSNIGANYAINRSLKGVEKDMRSYNLLGSLSYAIREWLRGSLTASHFNQDSDRPTAASIQRYLITLTLIATWS